MKINKFLKEYLDVVDKNKKIKNKKIIPIPREIIEALILVGESEDRHNARVVKMNESYETETQTLRAEIKGAPAAGKVRDYTAIYIVMYKRDMGKKRKTNWKRLGPEQTYDTLRDAVDAAARLNAAAEKGIKYRAFKYVPQI